jgi:Uma2 family endonuclease
VLVTELQSERHADLAIYRFPPDADEGWATWIPEIVVEVVSHSSRHRDYEEKPEEYLQFGVREYWIVDAHKQEMLVYRRAGGRWASKVVRPGEIYKSPTLRGFELDVKPVFDAARAVGG